MGVVVARDKPTAQRAARAVKVTYKELPLILTIEVIGTTILIVDTNTLSGGNRSKPVLSAREEAPAWRCQGNAGICRPRYRGKYETGRSRASLHGDNVVYCNTQRGA